LRRQRVERRFAVGERRVIGPVGGVQDQRRGRRRRIRAVKRRFVAIVAHVEQPVADGEMKPKAAWRVAGASRRDGKSFNGAMSGQRQGACRHRQVARDIGAGMDRRITDAVEEAQGAEMVAMLMREKKRIDVADAVDIGQQAGLRPFAEIEQQALAGAFDAKTGGALAAESGDGCQAVHRAPPTISMIFKRAPRADRRG